VLLHKEGVMVSWLNLLLLHKEGVMVITLRV
jgi:hypothetical protein